MKSFRFVNPKGHRSVRYDIGLVIDPEKFDPSNECGGGLHYGKEEILYFMDIGNLVYEVEPVGQRVKIDWIVTKYKAEALQVIRLLGDWTKDPNVLIKLIHEGADPLVQDGWPLWYASKMGYIVAVKALLSTKLFSREHAVDATHVASHSSLIVRLLMEYADGQ